MKTVYRIQGMTCNGCRSFVEKELSKLEQVDEVSVSLEKEEAVVTSLSKLNIAILRETLPRKYAIAVKEKQGSGTMAIGGKQASEPTVSKWRQLKPLFLILVYISVTSVLLHYKAFSLKAIMTDFMGLFFIVFSFFKLLDLKGFTHSFVMYDPLAARIKAYAWVYPFIEVALGLMLLLRWKIQLALVTTIFILGITTIGVVRSLLKKEAIQCACLGTALKLPMTEATFIENALMIIMAFSMLILL